MNKTTRFDAAEYLDTPKKQAAYINASFEAGDPDFVRDALGVIARAQGMLRERPTSIAKACTRRLATPEIPSSPRLCGC